jgi:hypothetical protein
MKEIVPVGLIPAERTAINSSRNNVVQRSGSIYS